ncbi:unnamed protein product [Ranitomeya imitator]|uniref:Protein kinase domain-containing protein n=1 Tax=Ranitomeya imitator TaxID=111125 RepID=A0ABN9KRS9_9NEOB|nr:unnamed protein product [Ranitomeya imitator]CAJ0951190.1 unnamed protein product [Ranitomeya imitator]
MAILDPGLQRGRRGQMLALDEYSTGVDWYAFGIILHKMITGECEYHHTLFHESHSGVKNIIQKMNFLLGLEYMSCGDVFDFLEMTGWLDIPSVRFYAAELVCGIQFLHSKGIVHTYSGFIVIDLKPKNILVAETDHIKIMDFGLVLENMFEDHKATQYTGTEDYMASEVSR